MFSAMDASSTIDFSRAAIDKGVVESPPSKDVGQTIVCSPSPLRSSRKNGICRSSSKRYTGSAHPPQLCGPSHVCSALEIMNAGESSPYFEFQIQATCRTNNRVKHMSEEQILEKMGATSESYQSSQRILRRKEFSEGNASIPMRRGFSTSDSHIKLVQQMKYASAHGRWSNMGSKKDCLTLISTNPISICSSHMNTKIVLDIGKLVSNMLYSCSS
jgi:hypothetical protein